MRFATTQKTISSEINARVTLAEFAKSSLDLGGSMSTHHATDSALDVSEEAFARTVERLSASTQLEYGRQRSFEAKAFGISVAQLDKAVRARRSASQKDRSLAPDPWPEPVAGSQLLKDIVAGIERHAVLPNHASTIIALWCFAAHAMNCYQIFPMLALESPEPGCGKSTVMELISNLVPNPILASNISKAAIFRVIEDRKPTLLIDEADTFAVQNDELRGVLNSGHAVHTARVIRCVGEGADLQTAEFSTWCPKVVALIGELPATLQSRSIAIRLRRKLSTEAVEKFRTSRRAEFDVFNRKIARWVLDNVIELQASESEMPIGLENRIEDNWYPLISVADRLGDPWPTSARRAAVVHVTTAAQFDEPSASLQLLFDFRDIFDSIGAEVRSSDMQARLVANEDLLWSTYSKGRPISPQRIARMVRDFGITPRQRNTGSYWRRSDFVDAWNRYQKAPPTAMLPHEL